MSCQKLNSNKNAKIMKKLILNPKTDTVTLCVPRTWVGKTVICLLQEPLEDEKIEIVGEASENSILYQAEHFRKIAKRKPRNKRLRRRYL
jgi:hypothetical protein